MALAALIFGVGIPSAPWGFACCLVFWMLRPFVAGGTFTGFWAIPVQLIQAPPVCLTVVLLAGFMGRAVAPKALDCPTVKTDRGRNVSQGMHGKHC